MAQNGPLPRNPRFVADEGPGAAELFDPQALEARLKEARARRAEALAQRGRPAGGEREDHADREADPMASAGQTRPPRPGQAEPEAPAGPDPALARISQLAQSEVPRPRPVSAPGRLPNLPGAPAGIEPAVPRAAPASRPHRAGRALLALLFLTGLGLGAAAALVAPEALRDRASALATGVLPLEAPSGGTAPDPGANASFAPEIATDPPEPLSLPAPDAVPAAPPMAAQESPRLPPEEEGTSAAGPAAGEPDQEVAAASAPAAAESPAPAGGAAEPGPPTAASEVSRAEPPSPPAAAAPAETAADVPRLSAPEPTQAADDPEATPGYDPDSLRVLVHYPGGVGSETVQGALSALRDAGFGEVGPVSARVSISRTNVRYFHDEDSAAAEHIAGLLGDRLAGEPPLARDFTYFNPPPSPGSIEIWLAGDAPVRAAQPAGDDVTEQPLGATGGTRDPEVGNAVNQFDSMVDAERLRALLGPATRRATRPPGPSAPREPLNAVPWMNER